MVKDVNFWRRTHLSVAEAIDAWRIVPRMLIVGYAFLVWKVVEWYMGLKPYLPEEFKPLLDKATDAETVAAVGSLMISEPSTQHSFLVSTIVTLSAAIFAFYLNTGKKWNGFTSWKKDKFDSDDEEEERGLEPPSEEEDPIPRPPRRRRKKSPAK